MQTMAPPEDALKERFARVDDRFVEVNRRFDAVDGKFTEVNRRITEGREEANLRFNRVEGDIAELKQGLTSVQKSVAAVQATLTRVGFGLALIFAAVLIKGG